MIVYIVYIGWFSKYSRDKYIRVKTEPTNAIGNQRLMTSRDIHIFIVACVTD